MALQILTYVTFIHWENVIITICEKLDFISCCTQRSFGSGHLCVSFLQMMTLYFCGVEGGEEETNS